MSRSPFSGSYNGDAFTITGLYMDQGLYQGLFGVLENANVTSPLSVPRRDLCGGLRGDFQNLQSDGPEYPVGCYRRQWQRSQ